MNRELKAYLNESYALLRSSEQTLSDIYRIMFRQKDSVLAETDEGYRIRRWTYGEVDALVRRTASGLVRRIGAKNRYVALEMENCVEWVVSFWAILMSGNKPFLVNTRHPAILSEKLCVSLEIEYVLGLTPTKLPGTWLDYHELASDDPFEAIFADEIALATSATTLQEVICFYNGVSLVHQLLDAEQILMECERMASFYHGALKQLAFLPFYHVFGLFAVYFWFSFYGRCIVFLKDYSTDTILRTIRRHEVTHIFAVPLFWHSVAKGLERELRLQGGECEAKLRKGIRFCNRLQDLSPALGEAAARKLLKPVRSALFGDSVRFCISGGSALRQDVLELMNALGYPLHNGYGMTETGITSVELRLHRKERNENSIGRPFHSVDYRLSERGTLLISGISRCSARMVNGVRIPMDQEYDSGDLARCENGNYFLIGRLGDSVIGENGENINPDELEARFSLPGRPEFSVLGLDLGEGEALCGILRVNPYLSSGAKAELRRAVLEQNAALPSANQLRRIFVTEDPIQSATAIKVSRPWLRRAIKEGSVHLTPVTDLPTEGESETLNEALCLRVREICAGVLGIEAEAIEPDAHLMLDLGADSLQYFDMLRLLGEEFHVTVSSESGGFCYTAADITRWLERYLSL